MESKTSVKTVSFLIKIYITHDEVCSVRHIETLCLWSVFFLNREFRCFTKACGIKLFSCCANLYIGGKRASMQPEKSPDVNEKLTASNIYLRRFLLHYLSDDIWSSLIIHVGSLNTIWLLWTESIFSGKCFFSSYKFLVINDVYICVE